MAEQNYYDILGINATASNDEIKEAYRHLVRKYHPDVSSDPNAPTKIAEVNTAYEVLKNPIERAKYNAIFITSSKPTYEPIEPTAEDYNDNSPFFGSDSFSFDTVFDAVTDSEKPEHIHENIKVDTLYQQAKKEPTQDKPLPIEIDLSTVYTGGTYQLNRDIPVRQKNGSIIEENKTLDINIPKGISDGKLIRVAAQGSFNMVTGKNNDLMLKVKIIHDPNIRINNTDVYQSLNITPWEAFLGANISLTTPAGDLNVRIPPESQSGNNLRIQGKGLPAKQAGDLFLTLHIVNPQMTNAMQKQAMEMLKSVFADTNIER